MLNITAEQIPIDSFLRYAEIKKHIHQTFSILVIYADEQIRGGGVPSIVGLTLQPVRSGRMPILPSTLSGFLVRLEFIFR